MALSLSMLTLLVDDYDGAIAYYKNVLHFTLLEDNPLGNHKRWVRMAPRSDAGTSILLAKAVTPDQQAHVGNQTGGRVFLFLNTDDFWLDYETLKSAGVRFIEQPRQENYGWVVVFQDLYGNKWDLLQSSEMAIETKVTDA
jgi:uncharacterized glyoxalase superfamily protein PhnB